MKKINEMTDQELAKAIETLKDVEEMKIVVNQLKAEQVAREKAAEAKRLEEEKKCKEDEAKRQAENAKKEQDLVEKQKAVLGKYFKHIVYDTDYKQPVQLYTVYYKVIGVYDDKVIVEGVKTYVHEYTLYRNSFITTFLYLNDLSDVKAYKPITREEYEAEAKESENTFDSVAEAFKQIFNFIGF